MFITQYYNNNFAQEKIVEFFAQECFQNNLFTNEQYASSLLSTFLPHSSTIIYHLYILNI